MILFYDLLCGFGQNSGFLGNFLAFADLRLARANLFVAHKYLTSQIYCNIDQMTFLDTEISQTFQLQAW